MNGQHQYMKLHEFDWKTIANQLFGTVRRKTTKEVEIAQGRHVYRLVDNNGEVLIYEMELLPVPVVYSDLAGSQNRTLANRIRQAIERTEIDYAARKDEAVEEEDE